MRDILLSESEREREREGIWNLASFCHLNGLYPVRSPLSAYVSLIKANMCQDQCRWRRHAPCIRQIPDYHARDSNANICLSYCKLIYAIFILYNVLMTCSPNLIAFSRTDKLHTDILIHFRFVSSSQIMRVSHAIYARHAICDCGHQKWH